MKPDLGRWLPTRASPLSIQRRAGCVSPCPPRGPETGAFRGGLQEEVTRGDSHSSRIVTAPAECRAPGALSSLVQLRAGTRGGGRRRAGPSRGWAAGGARRLLLAGPGLVSERSRAWRRWWESGSRWEQSGGRAVRPGRAEPSASRNRFVPAAAQPLRPPRRRSPLRAAGPAPAAPMRFGSKMMPVSPGPRRAESWSGAAGGKMDSADVERGGRRPSLPPSLRHSLPAFPRSARALPPRRGFPSPSQVFLFFLFHAGINLLDGPAGAEPGPGGPRGPAAARGGEGPAAPGALPSPHSWGQGCPSRAACPAPAGETGTLRLSPAFFFFCFGFFVFSGTKFLKLVRGVLRLGAGGGFVLEGSRRKMVSMLFTVQSARSSLGAGIPDLGRESFGSCWQRCVLNPPGSGRCLCFNTFKRRTEHHLL